MADKNIGALPSTSSLDDGSLFVAEQQGEAVSVAGTVFKQYARECVSPLVTEAAEYAQQAEEVADEIQTIEDTFYSAISLKGDNLEYDSNENKLYLTSNGERISDGITVATSGGGGGGGGGETNNATLSLTRTTDWIYKTIAAGTSCPLTFTWSSIEDGLATGDGVLKVTVNSVQKYTGQITQGSQSFDVSPYLGAGSNTVRVNVTDTYGNSRSINFNITAITLVLASTFTATTPFSGDIAYTYTPTGTVAKTVHFVVDGATVGTVSVTASGTEQAYTIPAQSHGSHVLEVYFTARVDGETVYSNSLKYDLMCLETGNVSPVISTPFWETTVEQYGTVNIPYIVYDPVNTTTDIVLAANGETVAELTVDRSQQNWSYRPEEEGELKLTITCGGTVKTINLTVTESQLKVEAETSNMSLYLSSYGRSNNEANPAVWTYGDVGATLTGFNFVSDGWLEDDEGITVLRVGGDARVEIPVEIFGTDFRTTGKTIEIEFASRNVLDYDAILATCWSGNRGVQITARQAAFRSELSKVTTRYKEDDHLRLTFVVEKKSGNRLIRGYVNGIVSGMVQYSTEDNFAQGSPVGVSIGSNDCTIDIYSIRVYDNDLSRFQVLNNWIADTRDMVERKDRYDRNNIFDDYNQIIPTTLRPHQCYLVLNCAVLPQYKGDKKTCSGYYVDPVDTSRSFTFEDAEIDVQGTSSQYYYVKNYKIKFKGGFTNNNGVTSESYAMNDNAFPTSEFTFKADVASSEGANNVVLAEMYNDLCPVKTPAQEEDSRIRQTIEGHPIVVFHDAGDGPYFIGKYNFNNDKGTPEVFGFTDGDESWEIRENGNALVSFKTDDFTGWETSFEARYPDKNTDITKLQQFVAWVASTDTSAVDTDEEKAERLNKFVTELEQWCSVDDAVFYYLFTLVFLCMDQREKNAFPTWIDAMQQWIWLFYDADSSFGTDNQGDLTYEYWMEDIDYTEAGDPVFNGQNNVFWTNMRAGFFDEIKAEYQRLRTTLGPDGNPLLSYDVVNNAFEAHQGQWSEAIYNEDAQRKGVEPLEQAGETTYLPMQHGKKEQHFKEWCYNRFRYMDSLFETGSAMSDRILMRAHAQANVTMTSFINMYGQVYYNDAVAEHRMVRDTAYEFEWAAQGAEDAVIGINNAAMISELGDLSALKLEYAELAGATHLRQLKIGDEAEDYSNHNLNRLTLGNNTLLRELDVRNCVGLVDPVDASGCTNIEYVYFDGTSITGLSLPNGGILKTLHLPDTMTNLTIRNQPKLSDFVMGGSSNLTTLRLEGVPTVVPSLDIVNGISLVDDEGNATRPRVRIVGANWEADDCSPLDELVSRYSGMIGLDEEGNNTEHPVITGRVSVPSITADQLSSVNECYPDLVVVAGGVAQYMVRYVNYDGTLLYSYVANDGDTAIDPVAAGLIDAPSRSDGTEEMGYGFIGFGTLPAITRNVTIVAQYAPAWRVRFYSDGVLYNTQYVVEGNDATTPADPTKASDEYYHYTFVGWDKEYTNITAATDVSAVFTASDRYYSYAFYNGDTLLESGQLTYLQTPVYTGEEPVYSGEDAVDYGDFIGWSPEVSAITEDVVYYATFTYIGQVFRKIVHRSSLDLSNSVATSLTAYALYGYDNLKSVSLPNVTSVGQFAFAVSGLTSVDLPAVTTISNNAFGGCSSLTSVNIPVVTTISAEAFYNCKSLATIDLQKTCTIYSYAFGSCTSLTSVILRSSTMCSLYSGGDRWLYDTPIAGGTGYIYVPSSLVSTYQANTYWGNYSEQFRALEDYTVDGTTTGALDETKI